MTTDSNHQNSLVRTRKQRPTIPKQQPTKHQQHLQIELIFKHGQHQKREGDLKLISNHRCSYLDGNNHRGERWRKRDPKGFTTHFGVYRRCRGW